MADSNPKRKRVEGVPLAGASGYSAQHSDQGRLATDDDDQPTWLRSWIGVPSGTSLKCGLSWRKRKRIRKSPARSTIWIRDLPSRYNPFVAQQLHVAAIQGELPHDAVLLQDVSPGSDLFFGFPGGKQK